MNKESYKLRNVSEADYEFIYQVKKKVYKNYVELNWGIWNELEQRKYFESFINQFNDSFYIIQYEYKDIGFYNGRVLKDGTYEIGNICIVPEYQGKGIGSYILKNILAQNEGRDITIQYFKQNPVGKLYERLGFVKSGETKYHYQMKKTAIKNERKDVNKYDKS